MATTITNKSTNPFYLVDPVTYAEFADRIVVYTSAEPGAELIGSGINPTVKLVAADVNTDVAGNTDITLTNMTVKQGVYGGVIVSSKADPAKPKISKKYIDTVTAELTGDTSVTIQNGNYKDVFGGGAGFNSTVTGDSVVNYYGGNVKALYGGGSDGAVTNGNASVNIIGSPAGGRISKIYGGGKDATVLGDTTVTFGSDANLINFTGTVYGGGKGKKSIVGGDRTLVFDNYSGDFNASIKDFTNIQLSGSTTVTVNKKLDKSVSGAVYEFILTDESLQNVNAMLTLTKKHDAINNVVVTIESQEMVNSGGTVYLIESKFFRFANSFNASTVLVQNSNQQQISEVAYNIIYQFDKKEGGSVAIEYLGGNLILDGTETEKVILSDADDEVNIVGGTLMAGLDTDGGDDIVNVQSGSTVNGGLSTGTGDDTLYIQKDTQVNGYVNMDGGNDRLVVNESASLSSDVIMGDGENTIDVNRYASITGRIILEDGSTNVINVKGGGISGVDSGDSTTTNTFIFDGFYDNSYVCTNCTFEYERYSGGVGSWQEVFIPDYDYYDNGYYVSVFVREDLVLGDSQDTVIFNSNAAVDNVFMGGGNDVLIINNDAFISESIYMGDGDDLLIIDEDIPSDSIDDIYLGAGNDVLELGTSHFSQLYANEGENVIIAKTHMTIDAEFMNLGATGSVLVIDNGATVELTGMSLGNFLSVQNEAVYLDQNASVISHGMQFIQNYTGHMTVADTNDLVIQAAPGLIPTAVAPYINTFTTGVDSSEINGGAGLLIQEGANVLDSELTFVGDAVVDGIVDSSDLMAANATIGATGTVVDSTVEVTGDIDVDGSVVTSDLIAGGTVGINGSVEGSTISADTIDVDGTVENSDLSATWINVNVDSLTGSLTATGDVDFSVDFLNAALVVDAPRIELTTDGILVTIATTTATTYNLNNDALLVQVDDDAVVAGPITMDVDLGALGWTNVILTGTVDADVAFNGNEVVFAGGAALNEVFGGMVTLDGDNTFVITVDSWFDWQQLVFNPLATLGFEIADDTLMSIDGYVDVDPMSTIVDQTVFGQNSALALGEWIYIQDWDNNFVLPNEQNAFPQGQATNLPWENVYIMENAQIWGAVALDNEDNELVISDGVEINGQTALYDYAAVLTLGGDDTVTVGAATINGTIKTDRDIDSGNDELILNGSTVNAAINQGVPAIEMGAGDDDAHITDSLINGDIDMGAGADTLIIDPTIVNGDIDLGSGDDIAEILDSTINGSITGGEGADDLLVDTSSVDGGISLDAGDDILAIVDSTIEVGIDTGADNDTIDILGSTINGDIDAGTGNDTVTITDSNTTINGDILLGTGDNSATLSNSVVTGSIIGDSGADDVGLSDGSVVQTDVILGDGVNTAAVVDSEIVGDLLGGSGDDEVTLTTAVIGGSIDLGSGGANDILSSDATVGGDVIMGTQQVLDELDIPIVPWDTTSENLIQVNPGSTLAVGGDVLMAGADNEIDAEGTLDVTGDVQMVAGDPTTNMVQLTAGGGTINVGGSMTMINSASSGSNRIEFQENLLAPGGDSALVITGPLTMEGEGNAILSPWYDVANDDELIVNDVNTTFQASGVIMEGVENAIGFGVAGSTDGAYTSGSTPELHQISRLELSAATMTFNAPVSMTGEMNSVEFGMFLEADQEGDIFVNGDTTVAATGDVDMVGAFNYFGAGIHLDAGEQSLIEVNGSTTISVTGDVLMDATMMNQGQLGLLIEEYVAPDISTSDGEVIVNESTQTTLLNGSLTMIGTGANNILDIMSNVTVTGAIVMGSVIGDALSLSNTLTLSDPGSCNFGSTITLIAEANEVYLLGAGDVTGLTAIYGGENYLEVGAGVTMNDVVSFGGIYDADQIGTEGYLIQANTENTVYVYGYVYGIDTTIDLGNASMLNDSADSIYVWGGTVGTYGIVTGNGDDLVDILSGTVNGPITMGSTLLGGTVYGTNTLNVIADPPAIVVGDVTMNSDSLNALTMAGLVDLLADPVESFSADIIGNVAMTSIGADAAVNTLSMSGPTSIAGTVTMEADNSNTVDIAGLADFGGTEEVFRAIIDGPLAMTALSADESAGTNVLTIGDVASITGAVTMDAGVSNTVTVDTGWVKQYIGGPMDGTYDSTADILSLDMLANTNLLDVQGGELIVSEAYAPGVNGITMKNRERNDVLIQPTNTISVASDGRLVMETGVDMGNMATDPQTGAYSYTDVTLNGESVEVFYYNYSITPATDIFDTFQNTIEVNGKMYTGNVVSNTDVTTYGSIDMIGTNNGITVTGPADTNAKVDPYDGSEMDPTDQFLENTSNLQTGLVGMHGASNTIIVYADNPGEAAMVSSDIMMDGMATGAFTLADANSITVFNNAHFFGGSITQRAVLVNTISITGVTFPGAGADGQDKIVESVVDGYVDMYLLNGNSNDARFFTTDINGYINMQTVDGGSNSLNVEGVAITRVTDGVNDQILLQPTVVVGSTVDGAITVEANGLGQSNSVGLIITDVNGGITMTAPWLNLFGSNGFAQAAVTAIDPNTGLDVLVEGAVVDANVIDGDIALTTLDSGGINDASLIVTDVGGGISMVSTDTNSLISTGLDGLSTPAVTSNDPLTGLPILLEGSTLRHNDIDGAITMDADTGNNTATLTSTDVHGSVTQDTLLGDNSLNTTGSYVGPVTGLSIAPDLAPGTEYLLQPAIVNYNLIDGDVSQNAPDGSNDAFVSLSNITGSLVQTSLDGNVAFVHMADIGGNVSQVATDGANDLDLIGVIVPEIIYTSGDIQPEVDLSVNIAGTVTQNSGYTGLVLGIQNDALLVNANTGNISQTSLWGTDDDATADQTNMVNQAEMSDSTTGDVTQVTTNGLNEMDITDSTTGALSQTSTNGYNDLTVDPSDVTGGITQIAGIANEMQLIGDAITPELTTVGGAISQTSTYSGLDDINTLFSWFDAANFALLDGVNAGVNSLSQTSSWGTDDSVTAIQTTLVNDIDIIDSSVGDITQTTTNGTNVLDITDSVTGAIDMTSTNGYNDLNIDPSVVSGTVDMTAGLSNTLDILGEYTPETNPGDLDDSVAESSITGAVTLSGTDNTVVATMANTGALSMTATGGDNSLTVTGQTLADTSIVYSDIASVVMSGDGNNTAIMSQAAVAGSITLTAVDGINSLTMTDGSVGAGITFVGGGISGLNPNVIDLDSVNVTGGIDTGTGISNITVTGTSIVTGGIATDGGSDSVSVKGTSVVDSVDTGAGDDRVNLNDSGVITGDIDVGTGSDRVVTTQAALDVSKVVFDEEVRISGGTTSFTVTDDNLGFVGQTLTLDDTGGVSTLTLGQLGTEGSSTDGVLGTVSTSGLDAVILDATGLVDGDVLVNATGATSWDTMDSGDTVQIYVDQLGELDSIVLVNDYEVGGPGGDNLDTWNANGVTDIALVIGGAPAVNLTFVDQPGTDDGIYQYTNGNDQWTLSFVDGADDLVITYDDTSIPNP